MKKWIISFLIVGFLMPANVYAGGLGDAKQEPVAKKAQSTSTANAVSSTSSTSSTQEVSYSSGNGRVQDIKDIIDGPVKNGENTVFEEWATHLGQKVDWIFDRALDFGEHMRFPESSDKLVKRVRQAVDDFGADKPVYSVLDAAARFVEKARITDVYNAASNGPITVNGYYKQRVKYTDNAFYEPTSPEDDVNFLEVPGIIVNYRFGKDNRNYVKALYEARFRHSIKSDEINDQGQTLGVSSKVYLKDDLYVGFRERFIKDSALPAAQKLKRIEYVEQQVTPMIGFDWGVWNVEASYDNKHRWFDSDLFNTFQYEQNTFSLDIRRKMSERFTALFDYDLSYYDYKKSNTRASRYWQITGGFESRLSKRSSFVAKVGFQDREYKRERALVFNQIDAGFSSYVASMSLRHRLTKRTTVDVSYRRAPEESSFTDNRFYIENSFSLGTTHYFSKKLRGRFAMAYKNRDFEIPTLVGVLITEREDNLIAVNANLDYSFKPWFIMSTGYEYERRNSNSSVFDYTVNSLTVDFTVPF